MTTHEILVAVRELLAVEERWTKGASARNKYAVAVSPNSEEAVQWCLYGACDKVDPLNYHVDLEATLHLDDLSWWHDAPERTHAEVLAVLDKAIKEEAC